MDYLLYISLFGSQKHEEQPMSPVEQSVPTLQCEGNTWKAPTFYALAKNGNIRTYKVSITDYGNMAILTTTKATTLGGKEQIDAYTYTEGVNIGKANETSYIEQAVNEGNSLIKRLLDKGFSTEIPTGKYNTDAVGTMKPMLASGWNPGGVNFPCITQPKYDGVRCILTQDAKGNIVIISRNGKAYDIPHLRKWAENNRHLLPLDGELYNHGELTFQEIISAVKKRSAMTDKISYVVYDKPVDGLNNEQRIQLLQKEIGEETFPVRFSEYTYVNSLEELDRYHDEKVSQGYEGAIIRNLTGSYEFGFRSRNLIKLKKFKDEEFEIADVIEATGRDSGTAVFVLKTSSGDYFNAKPQGTRSIRAEYLRNKKKLIGKTCTVQYQGLSDSGIPRFPSAIAVRDYE